MKVTNLLFAILGIIVIAAILLVVIHPGYARVISFLLGRLRSIFDPLFNIIP